jgi:hypothetical protein
MLTTLLSLFGGGLMRLLPEVFALFGKKQDNFHELAMLDKQIALQALQVQMQQVGATAHQQEVETQSTAEQLIALLGAQKEAMVGQMQLVGNKLIDGLNFLVRPIVTYVFFGMYVGIKICMIVLAFQQPEALKAVIACWTEDDAAVLSGILAFWFVGRVFDKKK